MGAPQAFIRPRRVRGADHGGEHLKESTCRTQAEAHRAGPSVGHPLVGDLGEEELTAVEVRSPAVAIGLGEVVHQFLEVLGRLVVKVRARERDFLHAAHECWLVAFKFELELGRERCRRRILVEVRRQLAEVDQRLLSIRPGEQ